MVCCEIRNHTGEAAKRAPGEVAGGPGGVHLQNQFCDFQSVSLFTMKINILQICATSTAAVMAIIIFTITIIVTVTLYFYRTKPKSERKA